jgi:predicted nucleic acid-binding protein
VNVVDSSGWLEYFADEPNAGYFAEPIEDPESLLVPSISIYEVFKRVHQQRGEDQALRAVSVMLLGQVVDIDVTIALSAAKVSIEFKLPMADSIIWATAQAYSALLWTQDSDFKDIDGVKYITK